MRSIYFLALATTLLLGVFAPGCGCNKKSGALQPPPPGTPAEPWAKLNSDVKAGGTAAFELQFADMNGNLMAATEIYMSLRDPFGRSAYNVTVKTDEKGKARFEDIPVGNYRLDFLEERQGKSSFIIKLDKFTGANAGAFAGTVNY